ncbi:MAG: metalloregulator ArsR/SmtB family transcription factor [Myxococcales bacterium FL481]|nr:MAG: metalloregulator ArsR/SmtB family transcription factor [Myxococcales bacterium FL481]
MSTKLGTYAEVLTLLGDENRLRLCVLLLNRELCVSDLVRVTGLAQPRVSTHLSRMREAGLLRHRRSGSQTFYGLSREALTDTLLKVLGDVASSSDVTTRADRERLHELDAKRRDGLPESVVLELDRDYSPGRTWQSLALGHAALLRLGNVLDVGSGDGTAASVLAPYCRSLTCIDTDARAIGVARDRLGRHGSVSAQVADVHALPFHDGSFDDVVFLHTLTFVADPPRALAECARVLRPGGRIVLLCLDHFDAGDLKAHYGMRHPGFTSDQLRSMLSDAGLHVVNAEVACREAKKPHLRVVLALAEKANNDDPHR